MSRAPKGLLLAATLLSTAAASAETVQGVCAVGVCRVTLTPAQLLAKASSLVAERRFDEARPMIAALENVPAYGVERHFLAGYVAVETGDVDSAIKQFRAALAIKPDQTRVRLELARAMMLKGNYGAAEHNFHLAEQDDSLPPEILATIRASRGLLRDRRPWRLTTEFGFAPDSNITNGTSAETIDVNFGNQTLPLTLQGNARARSGIGQTGSISAGYRMHLSDKAALLFDIDGQGVNYSGSSVDDYTAQIAAGPELRLSEQTSLSVQALGLQRWYGGQRANTQFGSRITLQHTLEQGQRIGLSIDARRSNSGFSPDYDGWNLAAYATYERVIARSMIASASVFARADRLSNAAYSGHEFGLSLGVGGELPHGINAGLSASVSRANYDAALPALSIDPRGDWRLSARAYMGLRSFRILGFSPSVTYSYSRNASSIVLYDSSRSRFAFALAHYF